MKKYKSNNKRKCVKKSSKVKLKNIADIPKNNKRILDTTYKIIGYVCDKSIKEFRRTNTKLIILTITNYKDSIIARKWVWCEDEVAFYENDLEIGSKVEVIGRLEFNTFYNGYLVNIYTIHDLGEKINDEKIDNAPIKRIELHAHTNMSKLDGLNSVYDYLEYAKKSKLKSIAITDNNSIQGFPELARCEDFKFIYGVELSLIDDEKYKVDEYENIYNIVILVTNQKGLKNLYKIMSYTLNNEIKGEPILFKSILNMHREGILVGLCFSNVNSFNYNCFELEELIAYFDYVDISTPKHYYFEGVNSMIKEIIDIGKKQNKLVIASSNCRYIASEYHKYHQIFKNKQLPSMHLRTTEEMLEEFNFLGKELSYELVVTNTNLINDRIEKLNIIPPNILLPTDDELKESILKIPSIKEEIVRISNNKLIELYGNEPNEIILNRFNFELSSIINNNYQFYYYITHKLVEKAHLDGEVVGSRGMIASSFIARLLGITELNPLPAHYRCKRCKYHSFDKSLDSGFDLEDAFCPICGEKLIKDGQNFPVEAFMSIDGKKLPDIDLNFSDSYRPKVYEYLKSILGEDNVIKDSLSIYVSEKNAYGYVKRYFEGKEMPRDAEMMRLSSHLSKAIRSTTTHPGGTIYFPKGADIYDYTPISELENEFGYKEKISHIVALASHVDVVKFDILKHNDPAIIKYLMNYVFKHPTDFPFDNPLDIPVDDKNVYKLFNSNLTNIELGYNNSAIGIPEFENKFSIEMLDMLKPTSFEELVKISALSHMSNVEKSYIEDRHLKELITTREDIMLYLIGKGVDKAIAYEIMEYVRNGKAYKSNKNNGKWNSYKILMQNHNVPDWFISSCEQIQYLFPKPHVAIYVYMSLKIAWFKLYSPAAFYGAWFSYKCKYYDEELLLSGVDELKEKLLSIKEKKYLSSDEENYILSLELAIEAKLRGINFLPSDKNKSTELFEVEDGNVRLPYLKNN